MALDRTWYNSLVDDDGSGLTGSVWDKADVDSLMDAVDAELARIGAEINGAWTPTLIGSGGGTATYSTQAGAWILSGVKSMVFGGRLVISSKGSLSGSLSIGGLPYAASGAPYAVSVGYWAGMTTAITSMHAYLNAGTTPIYLVGNNPSGLSTVPIDAGWIGAGFDIIIGGSCRVT